MRLLLISDNFYPVIGGAETYAYNLAKGLAGRGCEVVVLTNRPSAGMPVSERHAAGFTVLRDDTYWEQLPRKGAAWEKLAFGRLDFLDEQLGSETFDVVHANNHGTALIGAVYALSRAAPLVATFHEVGRENTPLGMGRSRLVYRHLPLDYVVTVSRFYTDVAKRFGAAKVRYIPFGIDLNLFKHREDHRLWSRPAVIGCLARFKSRKGLLELVKAGSLLRDRFPGLRIRLAGTPSSGSAGYEQEMRDLIAREGLTGDVTLETGVTLEDVPRFLHEIDVLVQPSTQEGLGVVLLEAMASGVPIVANNCDGFREIATHNHNAYLTAGNDPALLVEAVSSVITDGELRARLARNGLTFVQSRHALDDMIDQTIALYREVIQHAGKP